MGYSPYDYTLDTGLVGQQIWQNGLIYRPDDGEAVKAALVQKNLEDLAHMIYYAVNNGVVSAVYINGTNPLAGGYTPTVPIKILGAQGLYLEALSGVITDRSSTVKTGDSATTRHRQKTVTVGGGGPTYTIDITSDKWLALGTLPATTLTVVLRSSTAPIPDGGEELTLGRLAVGSGNISVEREDGSVIAVLPGSTRASVELVYWPDDGGWLLDGGFAYTLGASP